MHMNECKASLFFGGKTRFQAYILFRFSFIAFNAVKINNNQIKIGLLINNLFHPTRTHLKLSSQTPRPPKPPPYFVFINAMSSQLKQIITNFQLVEREFIVVLF